MTQTEPTIKLICQTCKKEYIHFRDDIPDNIDRIESNWCPECEDTATDYYDEKWIKKYRKRSAQSGVNKQLKISL